MQYQPKRVLSNRDKCLVMQPEVANKIGRTPALVLQQLHYWLSSSKEYGHELEGRRWINNSYQQWQEQLAIFSLSTIRRAFSVLEEIGIVLSKKLGNRGGDQTKSYTIDYKRLATLTIIPFSEEKSSPPVLTSLKHNKQLLKMSSSCVQNEQIIDKEAETTSETLNYKSEQPTQIFLQKLDKIDTNNSEQVKQVEERSKNKLVLELIQIWNQTIEEGRDPILLTKKRAQYLAAAFQQKFNSSLDDWKIFCQKIASSQFLMGKVKETFRATLDWVLKFEVIQRIFEGDFGIAKSYKEKICQPDKANIEVSIESSKDPVAVKEVHKIILNQLGAAAYQAWFSKASVDFEGADSTILILPNQFIADYVTTHFGFELRKLWTNVEIRCATS